MQEKREKEKWNGAGPISIIQNNRYAHSNYFFIWIGYMAKVPEFRQRDSLLFNLDNLLLDCGVCRWCFVACNHLHLGWTFISIHDLQLTKQNKQKLQLNYGNRYIYIYILQMNIFIWLLSNKKIIFSSHVSLFLNALGRFRTSHNISSAPYKC